jgi:hypothetical protein
MTHKRYKIKPEERGHRKPLSSSEKTVIFTIRMPKSLKEKAVKLGTDKVRQMIKDY